MIPGQLEASFLIFLTLGLIKQSNTHTVGFVDVRKMLGRAAAEGRNTIAGPCNSVHQQQVTTNHCANNKK